MPPERGPLAPRGASAAEAREWTRVQEIERAYHERKDGERLLPVNLEYWRRVLAALPAGEPPIGPATRVLDVGCGGAGILLAVAGGRKTGIDPLMGFYLEKFPFLRQAPVEWREGSAEDLEADAAFDVVFAVNMLDHTASPAAAAARIARALAPSGRLVLLLNVHLGRASRAYFARFYRHVDPPHPHHIHLEDVAALFPGLAPVHRQDVDRLWLDLRGHYEAHVIHKEERDRGKRLGKALNPFLYPLLLARLLGRPVHRRRPEERPLIASYLFLFRKPPLAPGAGSAAR